MQRVSNQTCVTQQTIIEKCIHSFKVHRVEARHNLAATESPQQQQQQNPEQLATDCNPK